ncbi:hypothetical protein [Sphingomonas sp.]|uniref:hypothetical protein n=1 Tax=Sphingomonas sp. TaxID=28214 RepID=UPI002FDAA432
MSGDVEQYQRLLNRSGEPSFTPEQEQRIREIINEEAHKAAKAVLPMMRLRPSLNGGEL